MQAGARTAPRVRLQAVRRARSAAVLRRCRGHEAAPSTASRVVDLPRIERVRLTYSYPEWTGLDANVDETTRDIRAVAGTNVKVEVFADAPLDEPALIVDDQMAKLAQEGHASSGNIEVSAPGSYQIGARVADEFVALTDEYTIEIIKDEKPVVEIRKPARDWRATSIEEVPVRVQAQDDFRLRDVELRYSVNGGEWQNVPARRPLRSTPTDESLLRLEELGSTQGRESREAPVARRPGLVLRRRQGSQAKCETDLFMVQVQPFERRFKQAQARRRRRRHGRRAGRDLGTPARDPARDLEPAAQRRASTRARVSSSKTARRCSRSCRPRSRNRRARWPSERAHARSVEQDERVQHVRREPGARRADHGPCGTSI